MAEEGVVPVLCDAECVKALEGKELVTLPSGLQYKDVVVGKGPVPPTGYQVGVMVRSPCKVCFAPP